MIKIGKTLAIAILLFASLNKAGSADAAAAQPPVASADLSQRMLYRRAVDTVIWGMPAVNYELMYNEMARKTHGQYNQIVYWSRLPSWRNQTLTPNPDLIYFMPFYDTHTGPLVLEIPPAEGGAINGTVMTYWQAAIEDVGPAGVDKGKGGKYLILPPGYDRQKVPDGYIPMPSNTYRGYALLRSLLNGTGEAEVAQAVAYAKQIKLYPLSQAGSPPPTVFVDAVDVVFDSTIPYDMRFFNTLNEIVQQEPWLERDKAMIDPLRTIGIERGKTFAPDAATQKALNAAIKEAHAWLIDRYETGLTPYYENRRWTVLGTPEMIKSIEASFELPDAYPVDLRGVTFTYAFFTPKHAGAGQFYLMAIRDQHGQLLNGRSSYRLTVPANVPVHQYWSATVYSRDTHTFIRNAKWPGRSSQTPGLKKNPDGSVDIFFGPAAPAGRESNWVPTDPASGFEVLFRLYGPDKALFEKTWVLNDIEKLE